MRILNLSCAAVALTCAMRASAQRTTAADALEMFRQQQLRVTWISRGDTTVQRGQPTVVRDGHVFLTAEDRSALTPIPVADIVKIELFRRPPSLAEEEVRVVALTAVSTGGLALVEHAAARSKQGLSVALGALVALAAMRPLVNAATSKIFEPQHWVTVFSR